METQWKDWRLQLASAAKGGIEFKTMRRDLPYSLVLTFNADYSADTFDAALRLGPDTASELVSFSVSVGSYVDGWTNVTLSLTKSQVATVAAAASDGDLDGLAEVVFDLLHTPSGGTQQLMLGGTIPLIGKVTDGA